MPFQNRVTPTGDIVAHPARGTLTGNRGILHDGPGRLGSRRWTTKAWITCALQFKGRHREVMSGRSWTELFFLDEATALAAGHRPCAECRRADYDAFRAAWACANAGENLPKAPQMDAVLHAERVEPYTRRQITHSRPARDLPVGTLVRLGEESWLVEKGRLHLWSLDGYTQKRSLPNGEITVLTPVSIVKVLTSGYQPDIHASVKRE